MMNHSFNLINNSFKFIYLKVPTYHPLIYHKSIGLGSIKYKRMVPRKYDHASSPITWVRDPTGPRLPPGQHTTKRRRLAEGKHTVGEPHGGGRQFE